MIRFDYLQQLLMISIMLSVISCTFVQKTKALFNSSKVIIIYSLAINILSGMIFCISFTNIKLLDSIWTGLFAFLGADSIYKSFEGKLSTYREIREQKNKESDLFEISKQNIK